MRAMHTYIGICTVIDSIVCNRIERGCGTLLRYPKGLVGWPLEKHGSSLCFLRVTVSVERR